MSVNHTLVVSVLAQAVVYAYEAGVVVPGPRH